MDIQMAVAASVIISGIATVLLVIVGRRTMRANIDAAEATRRNADAAHDVYEMQRRAAEPNLQLYDRVDDHTGNSTLIHAPVVTTLRNYGGRPARIVSAEYFIEQDAEFAHARSSTVVMPGGLFEFRLDWNHADKLKETRWADILENKNPRSESLNLRVRYAETDGTGGKESVFAVPVFAYRERFFGKAVSMQLVSEPQAPATIVGSRDIQLHANGRPI